MLEIVKKSDDFKIDNGVATDVIVHFPCPHITKGSVTFVSDPAPTGFVIQLTPYSANLIEYDKGKTVREIPYIFDTFGESPVTLPDIKKRLEDAKTADEAQEILEAVRLTSFGSFDDVNYDGMTEIFRYSTDDGPVAYWIRSDSAEKGLENGSGISVYAIDKKSDYIAVDYSRVEKCVMYHAREDGKTYSCSYKPQSTDVLYISALFSAIAKMFVSSPKDSSMENLRCEFNELMEHFDYGAYISVAGDIILPGNIPAADVDYIPEDAQSAIQMAEELAGVPMSKRSEESTDEISVPAKKSLVAEAGHKPEVVMAPREPEPEDACDEPEQIETPHKNPHRYTDMWLTASLFSMPPEELNDVPIHNYTGSVLRFIDNAVRGSDGRMTIPPEGPHVILELPVEGKLSSANTYIDFGQVQGIPISDIAPVKISAIPNVDGIIVVSSVYYADAVRAGLDVSRLFTANMKVQHRPTGSDKPIFYYLGLTKRF